MKMWGKYTHYHYLVFGSRGGVMCVGSAKQRTGVKGGFVSTQPSEPHTLATVAPPTPTPPMHYAPPFLPPLLAPKDQKPSRSTYVMLVAANNSKSNTTKQLKDKKHQWGIYMLLGVNNRVVFEPCVMIRYENNGGDGGNFQHVYRACVQSYHHACPHQLVLAERLMTQPGLHAPPVRQHFPLLSASSSNFCSQR